MADIILYKYTKEYANAAVVRIAPIWIIAVHVFQHQNQHQSQIQVHIQVQFQTHIQLRILIQLQAIVPVYLAAQPILMNVVTVLVEQQDGKHANRHTTVPGCVMARPF